MITISSYTGLNGEKYLIDLNNVDYISIKKDDLVYIKFKGSDNVIAVGFIENAFKEIMTDIKHMNS